MLSLFNAPGASVRMRGQRGVIRAKVKNGKLDLRAYFKSSDPVDPAADPNEFRMESQPFHWEGCAAAAVHSALLRLFYLLGYEYLVHAPVSGIREDLAAVASGELSEPETVERFRKYHRVMTAAKAPEPGDVHVVKQPSHARGFLVFIPMFMDAHVGVLMPGFGEGAQRLHLSNLAHGLRADVTYTAVDIADHRGARLVDQGQASFGRMVWEAVQDGKIAPRAQASRSGPRTPDTRQ
jgi:hypothetical protein